MALVKCPECGNQVSDRASACPKCGYPFNQIKPTQERMEKSPNPPDGRVDFVQIRNESITPQTALESQGINKLYRISKTGSPDGLQFISSDDNSVYLKCTSCGKLLKLRKNLFENVDCNGCDSLITISCPHCAKEHYRIENSAADQSKGEPNPTRSQNKTVATESRSGCSKFVIISIAIIIIFSLAKCSGAFDPPSSDYHSNDYQDNSASEEDALEEELSHYHYDRFGHLEDDRDPNRF